MLGRILVVEINDAERKVVAQLLKAEGYTVLDVESADKAMSYVDEDIDVVVSDLKMGDVSGIDLLHLWKNRHREAQFIFLNGHSSLNTVVDAIKSGADGYLTRPLNPTELLLTVKRAMESLQKDRELDTLRRRLDQRFGLDQIVGQSRQMKEVFARIQRAAPVDSTVLILGESGTGKELVAQSLHQNSLRKNGPFVAVNCAALPATLVESELFGHVRGAFTGATDHRVGRFEQATGGTLFIDEIGDFEQGLQGKLLRVLESLTVTPVGSGDDRSVDVRVVAATSRDLMKMVEEGTFREDLYYRLNVVQIALPPLRERADDIPMLVARFLMEITEQKHTPVKRVAPEVMRRFQQYRWPGNVRELRNMLESMIVLAEGSMLTERDLPAQLAQPATVPADIQHVPSGLTIEQLERLAITQTLDQLGGNRTHAAQRLGISVRTLQRKLQQYKIDADPELSSEPTN